MSKTAVGILLLVAIGAAAMGYHVHEQSLLSPFVLGTVRAGMRFRDADDDARREMGHGYDCRPVSGVQVCRLISDAPEGVLTHVVDASGRVAVIQFQIADNTQRTREIGSRQIAAWSHVHPGDPRPSDSDAELNVETWKTADGRWSAFMTWRRVADAPGTMSVTDERRLRRIADSSPATILELVQRGLLDSLSLAAVRPAAPPGPADSGRALTER